MRISINLALRLSILALLCTTIAFVNEPARAQTGTDEAYFVFSVSPAPDTFVFKLTDPTKIQQARDILRTGRQKIVAGTIIKRPVYYNSPWSFYLDPKTITFADLATEVCDSSIRGIENNLDAAYPSWCPWNTRLLREVAPPSKPGTGNLSPNISMTSPYRSNAQAGTAPTGLTIAANADDPDGTISKVEFFSGTAKLGEKTAPPYTFNWNNIGPGTYTLSAAVTDNQGARSASQGVNFTVTQPTNSNPVDDAQFFVAEHYRDFLNREPDAGGAGYWSGEITKCGADASCVNSRRIGVSAAFFIESEFQETGGFVYRFYKASYGERPRFSQFMFDREKIVAGADLETGKQAFAADWVGRAEFLAKYPDSFTDAQFVDALIQTVLQGSGVDLSSKRQTLIDDLSTNKSRARVLRMIVDDSAFAQAEYNRAFVVMQYFGYLRRDPDEGGYLFWLDVLNNKVPGNFRGMVCAFLTSAEYQNRFSPLQTRNDSICAGLTQ